MGTKETATSVAVFLVVLKVLCWLNPEFSCKPLFEWRATGTSAADSGST